MKKSIIYLLIAASSVFGYVGQNRAAERYYKGEISLDQYLDQNFAPVYKENHISGEIRPRQFGSGYEYSDSTGRRGEIRQNNFGIIEFNTN